ncbi:MAG: glycosyltransferase family A protein [Anaerolineales bacterium]|jgi:glycosyltransferase involved in cell wall biosynthesis
MPTHNRRRFVPRSIVYFQRQDYPNRELIILDDGSDPVRDLVPDDPRIRYHYIDRKRTVGYKRNLACQAAAGEVTLHWDDDDWATNWRVSYQVDSLISTQSEICGLDRIFFYDLDGTQAWEYVYKGKGNWVYGGTLCYTMEYWSCNPFPDLDIGEDNHFVLKDDAAKVLRLADNRFYLGLIHSGNTSRKRTFGSAWRPVPMEVIQGMLEVDKSFYIPEPG